MSQGRGAQLPPGCAFGGRVLSSSLRPGEDSGPAGPSQLCIPVPQPLGARSRAPRAAAGRGGDTGAGARGQGQACVGLGGPLSAGGPGPAFLASLLASESITLPDSSAGCPPAPSPEMETSALTSGDG